MGSPLSVAGGAAIASASAVLTVDAMSASSTLHQAARNDRLRGRLGRLAELGDSARSSRGALQLVKAAAPVRTLFFPLGAQTRTVDGSGRLKFTGDSAPSRVLGWKAGSLLATVVEGWLVLSQPGHLVGESAARYSCAAGFTVAGSGLERVMLKPAHLDLVGLSEDRNLLVAAVPDTATLVVVNPATCLSGAPIAVAAALETVQKPPPTT